MLTPQPESATAQVEVSREWPNIITNGPPPTEPDAGLPKLPGLSPLGASNATTPNVPLSRRLGPFAKELAARVSDTERTAMENRRAELTRAKFERELSNRESRELSTLNWKLDELELAENSVTLDTLAALTAVYSDFSSQLRRVVDDLEK